MLCEKTLLLDLETNGLHPQNHQIISIGTLYKDDFLHKDHAFIASLEEEKTALIAFLKMCSHFETVVTFRGKAFDLPFLIERLHFHGLAAAPFLKLKHIDTEKYLKPFTGQRAQLEKALHFSRCTSTTGREIIKLYQTYLASLAPIYKDLILKHQADELYSLQALWELYQMLYHLKKASLLKAEADEKRLLLTFEYPDPFTGNFSASAFEIHFKYTQNTPFLQISYPLFTGTLQHDLKPFKDYYYIDTQKQLIHKSLAHFIPADLKRKATKQECHICEKHTFFRIFTHHQLSDDALWHDADQHPYLIWDIEKVPVLTHQIFSLFFHGQSTT